MGEKTGRKLSFGIMIAPMPPWKQIVEQARLIESLGFDKLWLPDHFVNPIDQETDWLDCWSVLTALGTQTDKIILGTLVSSMTLRNPAILARMALSLDHISDGRLELGVGAAGVRNCHKMTGVPFWEGRERSERYKEFVEILDQILTNGETTYEGKYYDLHETILKPDFISIPRPVLNVAAHGLKALRLAARHGDAWNCLNTGKDLSPKQSSDLARQRCESMCEFAVEFGRDPDQIGRTLLFYLTGPDQLFSSIDAFYDAIGRYSEAGINDFCFFYLPGLEEWKEKSITSEDQLRQIAHEAIPAVQETSNYQ